MSYFVPMLDQDIASPEVATLPLDPRNGLKFGGKTAGLTLATQLGLEIPPTIALSADFVCNLTDDLFWQHTGRETLELRLNDLKKSYHYDGNFIVRSSHDQESGSGASTSGLFQSHRSSSSLDDVRKTVIELAEHSLKVRGELERMALSPPSGRLSVLIQPLISSDLNGIASISEEGIEIEYTASDFPELMSGRVPANRLFIHWGNLPTQSEVCSDTAVSQLLQVLPISTMRELIGKSMEFLIRNRRFIAVQINNFNAHTVGYKSAGVLQQKGEGHCSISKFNAMREFVNCGLFTNPVLFVAPETNNEEAFGQIENFWTFTNFISLRLARGAEIGLPRGFFSSLDAAKEFLTLNRDNSFHLIAHPFMNVTHSFEINVERDGFYMEHVPGLWESNSHLSPDTFFSDGKGVCHVNCFRAKRQAYVAHPDGTNIRTFGPIDTLMARRFAEMASEVTTQIRAMPSLSLPVNVHAVWDDTSGEYQCLNIRPSVSLHRDARMPKRLYTIEHLSDLDGWNGTDAVLFQATTERGRETELVRLASTLAEQDAIVFVKFGLLSHPAMVLRDCGCAVYPFWCGNQSNNLKQTFQIQLDLGSDAYERIMQEPAVEEDSYFHIVRDAQPLAPFHLLSVAREKTPSVADASLSYQAEKIFNKHASDGAFFFERGRASFCTSGFATAHAHFHIVKGIDNVRTFEQLTSKAQPNRFHSLHEAYAALDDMDEYCVFGSAETGYAAFLNKVIGKRFFRTSIKFKISGQE